MRIGIVGSGIAGLSCAYALNRHHDVCLIEAQERLGGHAHTQTVVLGEQSVDVDTGYIVYNERNYPDLIRLFGELGVSTQDSDMSFAASVDDGRMEYCGSSALSLFAQPSNFLRPKFYGMLRDVLKFNRLGVDALHSGAADDTTLATFLEQHGLGRYFQDYYLLPMGAAIWSMPMADMLEFPAATFLRFFDNHGLLTVNDHPQWRTLTHRSADYVARIVNQLKSMPIIGDAVVKIVPAGQGLALHLRSGRTELVDQLVMAGHADQSRELLDPSFRRQKDYLGHFRFQANDAVLHSDLALMPRRKRAWASWNYLTSKRDTGDHRVSLTYWMNKLQSIETDQPLLVTLNPIRAPQPELVHNTMVYEHPVFDAEAVAAQSRLHEVQGLDGIWFAGAWLGYGFHEDGARSGLDVAAAFDAPPSWQAERRAQPWRSAQALAA